MQTILKRAAIQDDVLETFLEYIGTRNETHTVGKVLYHLTFRIQAPSLSVDVHACGCTEDDQRRRGFRKLLNAMTVI